MLSDMGYKLEIKCTLTTCVVQGSSKQNDMEIWKLIVANVGLTGQS